MGFSDPLGGQRVFELFLELRAQVSLCLPEHPDSGCNNRFNGLVY